MKRRAFTMIELMTVIGIIVILGGLLVIGIGKLQTSAKRRQTQQILNNAQALIAEYDASQRTSFRAAGPMDCPTSVSGADRTAEAVMLSRDVIQLMQSIPANATAIGKLPADAKLALTTTTAVAPVTWSAGASYTIGKRVNDNLTPVNTYACIKNISGTTNVSPPAIGVWVYEPPLTTSVPVLLDAWNNPIIFVPVALGNGGAAPGALFAGGNSFVQQSPDNRPFFASAGPDGDFSKGDDNIYSFEK